MSDKEFILSHFPDAHCDYIPISMVKNMTHAYVIKPYVGNDFFFALGGNEEQAWKFARLNLLFRKGMVSLYPDYYNAMTGGKNHLVSPLS